MIDIITNCNVQYPSDLFPESMPSDTIAKALEKFENGFFIYNIADPGGIDDDLLIFQATVLKTVSYYSYKVYDKLYYNAEYEGLKKERLPFNYRNKPVHVISADSSFRSVDDCYQYTVVVAEEVKRRAEFNRQVDEANKAYALSKQKGHLSVAGWEYFNSKMEELLQNDPPQIKEALWFIRKEMKQRRRPRDIAINNAAQKYDIDAALLFSRNQSRIRLWGYAKKK
jgi:hypothetical protein